jgi:hypothetical protein
MIPHAPAELVAVALKFDSALAIDFKRFEETPYVSAAVLKI